MQNDTFKENNRIPIHGSMTRPANPEEGLKEMIDGRILWKNGDLAVTISTDEFTSVCPTTGQPDFSEITIEYVPDKFYLESKTVKFYLWSYRDHGAHCETLANMICRHIKQAIQPKSVRVKVNQSPRGGLRIVSEATWKK
jgi:7-cyano-7-deazaguanine reductase